MAAYLRFNERTYAGWSKYRPGEGWIDVVLWGFKETPPGIGAGSKRKPPDATDGIVKVTFVSDPGALRLTDSFASGVPINGAVLEDWRGSHWKRIVMSDVTVVSVQYDPGMPNVGPTITVELQFQAASYSMGKQ
jgi:hypothetical protein